MPVREIVQMGDPRLRTPCSVVVDPCSPQVAAAVEDLKETLAHCRQTTTYGRAIAAPQIGVMARILFFNVDAPWPLINPEIVERSDETMVVWDACLSFLCIFFQVMRHKWIKVRYQDVQGAWHEIRAEGDLSELLQHEIDHLDGILAIDRLADIRTMCTREEFERRFRAESPYAS
ncbi:MAG TPA: peptide deformylase [Symbiobacteriaceae bacterium]|nr:peptide deformylase [Symbiobacteriaceae bacterium]